MKKCYIQPDADLIKLVSNSVITESLPGKEEGVETTIVTSGNKSYNYSKDSDSYIY